MAKGYFKLHRQLWEGHWVASKPEWGWMWTTILAHTSYKDSEFLKAGEVMMSVRRLAELSGVSDRKAQVFLAKLQEDGMLTRVTRCVTRWDPKNVTRQLAGNVTRQAKQSAIYKVNNYNKYQEAWTAKKKANVTRQAEPDVTRQNGPDVTQNVTVRKNIEEIKKEELRSSKESEASKKPPEKPEKPPKPKEPQFHPGTEEVAEHWMSKKSLYQPKVEGTIVQLKTGISRALKNGFSTEGLKLAIDRWEICVTDPRLWANHRWGDEFFTRQRGKYVERMLDDEWKHLSKRYLSPEEEADIQEEEEKKRKARMRELYRKQEAEAIKKYGY